MRRSERELTQLDRIERNSLLAAKNVLTVEDAAILLGLSPSTKPNGKLVFFNKKELEEWMMRNRVASEEEIMDEAANY